jgi:hypothetical protein
MVKYFDFLSGFATNTCGGFARVKAKVMKDENCARPSADVAQPWVTLGQIG